MDSEIEQLATYMKRHALTLATAESCTAGLIAATLADVPGAGALLECAFVTYSPQAKQRLLGLSDTLLQRHNLTSEAVARAMALGAAQRAQARVVIANTGVTDGTDPEIPAGTQCYAWVIKRGAADAAPAVFTETRVFTGGRNAIRRASATYALLQVQHYAREALGQGAAASAAA
ncbi:CinA family protein [Bordetella genomosp. 1]|uniref:CinA family protein n=1 Tax=Bordetella genomosp. 1 TaxID=1395607 RepID=UPI00159588F0|nr:CinA family protein [Bordetella genomosp. 1]